MTDDLNCHVTTKPDFGVSSEAWKRFVMQDLYASGMEPGDYLASSRYQEALTKARRETEERRDES